MCGGRALVYLNTMYLYDEKNRAESNFKEGGPALPLVQYQCTYYGT